MMATSAAVICRWVKIAVGESISFRVGPDLHLNWFRYRSWHNNACMRLMAWNRWTEGIFFFSAATDDGGEVHVLYCTEHRTSTWCDDTV